MAATTLQLIFLLSVAKLQTGQAAPPAADENAAPFGVLCNVLKAAQTAMPNFAISDTVKQIAFDAKALNLSLSAPEAAAELADTKTTDETKLKASGIAKKIVDELSFGTAKAMATRAQELKKTKAYADLSPTALTPAQMHQLQHKIALIATTAGNIDDLNIKKTVQEATTNLNKAIYGSETIDDKIKLVDAASHTSRDKSCGKIGDNNDNSIAGNSLKGDIMCLCAKSSGGGATQVCGSELPAMTADGSAATELEADWKKLKAWCKPPTDSSTTAPGLLAAAAAAEAYIAASAGQQAKATHIIGKHHDTTTTACDAGDTSGSNQGACVYYGRKIGAQRKIQINWLQNLRTAAAEIEKATTAYSTSQMLTTELTRLNESLAALAVAAQLKSEQHQATPAPATNEKHKTEVSDCTNHSTNSTCTKNNNCKWEGQTETDGTCKPKTGTENTAAGTGEAATEGTAATTGCAKHGTKANCENDKTGDKQNCAWRKGKEGEDDKDTEKCRNGSFLLNKHFALTVVSAAFVALLF
uniref:Variant surface glycoprotein n=1 Tax=Trypanosoma brucei TaxID=5691 RepID=A0A1V0FXS7_9TRYP|nr:variant surface glycoprotein [Trypanosoma brucei]